MPHSVLCSGCGHKLIIRDELLGKRVKCPQCQARFIAEIEEPEEEDATEKAVRKLSSFIPVIGGLALIVIGLLVTVGTYGMVGGRMISRGGLGMIGLGIAWIGYWALSSENKDYNF